MTGSGAAFAALAVFGLAFGARAEVVDSQPNGFTVRNVVSVGASPAQVWRELIRPAGWWDGAHTYSASAANLTLDARPGGLWREVWPGGGVLHMTVVNVAPGRLLRLDGALGPLQGMGVVGRLTWSLEARGSATIVTETYDVGGHAPGGLGKLSLPVSQVLDEQLARLKRRVETGRAD